MSRHERINPVSLLKSLPLLIAILSPSFLTACGKEDKTHPDDKAPVPISETLVIRGPIPVLGEPIDPIVPPPSTASFKVEERFQQVAVADFTPEQKALYFSRLKSLAEFLEEMGRADEYDEYLDWLLEWLGRGAIDVFMDPKQPDMQSYWLRYSELRGFAS